MSTTQTLLLFLLVRPDNEQQHAGISTTSAKHNQQPSSDPSQISQLPTSISIASRALSMLRTLYSPIFDALSIQQQPDMLQCIRTDTQETDSVESTTLFDEALGPNGLGHSSATTPSTDAELLDMRFHVNDLLRQYWQLWIFPVLHAYSIIAAFCPDQAIRSEALSVRK